MASLPYIAFKEDEDVRQEYRILIRPHLPPFLGSLQADYPFASLAGSSLNPIGLLF
jgi:hypothetical protein